MQKDTYVTQLPPRRRKEKKVQADYRTGEADKRMSRRKPLEAETEREE